MAYTDIDNPELYFQTKLYTGDGNSSKAITLDGDENIQPDWVWVKSRSTADYDHQVTDSVRGTQKTLKTNTTGAEDSNPGAGGIGSFDSDGFTIAEGSINNTNMNNNTTTYVAWNWKAGTSFSNDASATSVGSIDSTGSVSTTAGFSIISYTGTGSNATVGHGLGSVPKCIIFKDRDTSSDWRMYHVGVGNTGALTLNNTNATQTNSVFFQDTTPTSTVFSLGTGTDVNNTNSFIAYCFAEKKGFSKFGSYTGNGQSGKDGVFIHTGFAPAWVLQKNAGATQGWQLQDNKRDGRNGANKLLQPHTSQAESDVNRIDILSNGFKVITSDAGQNSSGTKYIFMAFAESPFVTSTGIPTTAR